MNILWITNTLLPEATAKLGGATELKGTGSWMLSLAEAIVKQPGINLTIATVDRSKGNLRRIDGEKIVYYLLPGGKRGFFRENPSLIPYWQQVRDEVKPDVIHIHGTEYTHGLAWFKACGAEHVCVSVQGLVSAYYYYYYYGITPKELRRSKLHNMLFKRGILAGARDFMTRGECEKEIFRRVHHIIGRTSWDKARTWAINPEAQYHYGGEILRKEFYQGDAWSYEKCEPHSIFLSQGGYPVKGFHMVLRAMPLVLRHYPDAVLRVAGRDSSKNLDWKDFIKSGDYHAIIRNLIHENHLEGHVAFTGPLNAEEMKNEYLRCNVFVCPSTIENSPNSLGEAQLLGTPVLASYVGGVMDMMKGDEEHMYRFEEVELLAEKLCNLFAAKANQPQLKKMRMQAMERHNATAITESLVNLYKSIINE